MKTIQLTGFGFTSKQPASVFINISCYQGCYLEQEIRTDAIISQRTVVVLLDGENMRVKETPEEVNLLVLTADRDLRRQQKLDAIPENF